MLIARRQSGKALQPTLFLAIPKNEPRTMTSKSKRCSRNFRDSQWGARRGKFCPSIFSRLLSAVEVNYRLGNESKGRNSGGARVEGRGRITLMRLLRTRAVTTTSFVLHASSVAGQFAHPGVKFIFAVSL